MGGTLEQEQLKCKLHLSYNLAFPLGPPRLPRGPPCTGPRYPGAGEKGFVPEHAEGRTAGRSEDGADVGAARLPWADGASGVRPSPPGEARPRQESAWGCV